MRRSSLPFPPPAVPAPRPASAPFASSSDQLRAELGRIDLLLRAQALRARQLGGEDPYRGLAISDQEVDALFARPLGVPAWSEAPPPAGDEALTERLEALREENDQRSAAAIARGTRLRLESLATRFQLTRFDRDAFLIGLAPELDLRYERLFGYLRDDATRRRPSIDLALGLLCATFEERLAARARFAATAPLRRHGLIHVFGGGGDEPAASLGAAFGVDVRIAEWLQGSEFLDARLLGLVRVIDGEAAPDAAGPERIVAQGARLTDEAIGAAIGQRLLVLDGARLEALGAEAEERTALALREAVLHAAVPCWSASGKRTPNPVGRAAALRALAAHPGPLVLRGAVGTGALRATRRLKARR